MDWDKVYESLLEVKLKGRRVNSPEIIDEIKRLSEWHRKMFVEYFEAFFSGGEKELNSFKSFRHPILEFLLQEKINSKFFSEINQDDIDDFLINKGQNIKLSSLINNQNSIKNYLNFHAKHMKFIPKYMEIKKEEVTPKNQKVPLNCKELEKIREIIINEDYLKFIFELAYENGIRFEYSRDYNLKNYIENESKFIAPDGKHIIVSERLKNIINKIKDKDEFRDPYYKQGFSKKVLYNYLKKNGFNRAIKSSDVNDSYKSKTSFKCPECGTEYEAIADNWILKQYYNDGEMWIVCRKKCGVHNEDI